MSDTFIPGHRNVNCFMGQDTQAGFQTGIHVQEHNSDVCKRALTYVVRGHVGMQQGILLTPCVQHGYTKVCAGACGSAQVANTGWAD